MADPKPFRQKVFLFRLLGFVFATQAVMIGYAFYGCERLTREVTHKGQIQDSCPDLSTKAENLFSVATATVLSLLTGSAELSN